MSVIKLTSNYANVDHQAACRALRDFVATPQSRKRDWLRLLLLAIGIGLVFGAIVRYSGIDFSGLYLPFILFVSR